MTKAPLVIPPDFNLRPPKPGAPPDQSDLADRNRRRSPCSATPIRRPWPRRCTATYQRRRNLCWPMPGCRMPIQRSASRSHRDAEAMEGRPTASPTSCCSAASSGHGKPRQCRCRGQRLQAQGGSSRWQQPHGHTRRSEADDSATIAKDSAAAGLMAFSRACFAAFFACGETSLRLPHAERSEAISICLAERTCRCW